MVRERRWWSIPRVPPPTWWRRRDSSASRTERRPRSVVVDISEPLESKLVPSRAAPAVPSPPIECSHEDMPSISFSFFEENAKTDETELEVKSERQCDGCEETEDILEEKVEKDVESEEVKVDEVEDPLVTKEEEEDQHDIDEETKEVNLEEISQETKEEKDVKELNGEAEEEKEPEEIKEEKEMQEVKREIRERPTSLAEDSPPCGSDGGYEVLRVRSEPDMLPRESARVGVSEPRYASPRASFAPWDGSEVCSLSDTYLYQTTSEARSEATKAEDYEELEYCAVRAGQRRATLFRGPGRGTSARVGRAWRALRVWWRSERSRLAQAVQRHARAAHALAAAAATSGEAPAEEPAREQPKEEEAEVAESTAVAVVVHRRRREEPRSRPLSRAGLVRSRYIPEGQNGFEELRRYIKQGGDFCKDLSSILQERSEAETQYAKTLSKLSGKLLKASKDSVGSVNQAWQRAGAQMEAQSEAHRAFAAALSEEVVKPLRQLVESQHRIRKSVESVVDKTAKSLSEWRAAEAKSKKQSFLSARENEKLQDVSLDVRLGRNTGSAHALHHNHKQVSDKECAKLESKRRKAEEHVKKADVEYYTFCIRAERARLEWETAVIRGSHCFQALEEERLQQLKDVASCYLHHLQDMGPKLIQSTEKMTEPVQSCDVARDIQTVVSIKGTGQPIPEQLLPDFYAEHITLAMNRERRRQALVKILQLIRQDLERERRGKQGVESLARALQQTPNFGAEDSQQNLSEKLHHMRSMLTYLEAARYKVQSALAELDGRTRGSHPLAPHIQVTRDKQGLQQSVLKVPPWVRKESLDQLAGEAPDWTDRGAGDGNSVQPDSDFDEFSSQGSEKDYQSSVMTYPVISECSETPQVGGARCRALYEYAANLYDELNIRPGDVINIHDKQADGWWLGELNGVIGIFPATYVEEIK